MVKIENYSILLQTIVEILHVNMHLKTLLSVKNM